MDWIIEKSLPRGSAPGVAMMIGLGVRDLILLTGRKLCWSERMPSASTMAEGNS